MRNNILDFYRIIFTLIICLHHFQGTLDTNIISTGYIGVEFFFILSGFFLYKSFKKNNNDSAFKYTVKRIKRLYPEYILAFILCFILQMAQSGKEKSVDCIFQAISEITLTQNVGIFHGGFNYPLWYLSVLIFAGYIVYALLKKDETTFIRIISPITILFTFSLLNSQGTGLENWNTVYGIYLPLLRGISDICIGVLISKFVNTEYFKSIENSKVIFRVVEILTYICLLYIIIFQSKFEMYSILFIPITIIAANNKNSLSNKFFNWNIFGNIGKITYTMYLNHASFIILISFLYNKILHKNISTILILIIYIGSLILYSMISRKIVYKMIDKNKKSMERG